LILGAKVSFSAQTRSCHTFKLTLFHNNFSDNSSAAKGLVCVLAILEERQFQNFPLVHLRQ
jgi:hypothetical protein